MNDSPEKNDAAPEIPAARAAGMDAIRHPPAKNMTAPAAYGAAGVTPYSNPPTAGPTICAVCVADADQALPREIICRGTRPGSSAVIVGFSNARAAPRTAMTASMRGTVSVPVAVPIASAAAAPASTTWQSPTMRRRS